MRKFFLASAAVMAMQLIGAVWLVGQEARSAGWVHIEVIERGGDGSKVHVNLPVSLALAALDLAPKDVMKNGRVHVDADVDLAKLRRLWEELRKAPDHEFVTVEEKDQTVRMEKRGGKLLIAVDRRRGNSQKVRINVNENVVDALLSGEGRGLNVRAALEELKDERGELVTVQDGDNAVRIWVDDDKG